VNELEEQSYGLHHPPEPDRRRSRRGIPSVAAATEGCGLSFHASEWTQSMASYGDPVSGPSVVPSPGRNPKSEIRIPPSGRCSIPKPEISPERHFT
jgi:hypothetical protein